MNDITTRSPEQCADMAQIRQEIDAIDLQVITLLGRRFDYVKAAAKFKTSPSDVQAQARFDAMLVQRREWAQQQGLSADVVERMYRDLVGYFIREEMHSWNRRQA